MSSDNDKSPFAKNSYEEFNEVLSPGRGPGKDHLTGSERKIRDCAADIHNSIEKWDDYNVEGSDILSELANLKLQKMFNSEGKDLSTAKACLQDSCDKLEKVINKLEKVLRKMEKYISHIHGIANLQDYNFKHDCSNDSNILFDSWETERFYETVEELLCIYKREFEVKKMIMQNVAHLKNRDEIMFFLSCWQQQPFTQGSKAVTLLESLLHETGLR